MTEEEHYCLQYYEVLDVVISNIRSRIDQPGYLMCENLESLLVGAANNHASIRRVFQKQQNYTRMILIDHALQRSCKSLVHICNIKISFAWRLRKISL